MQLQRTLLEGRAFDVINLATEDMHEPKFKSFAKMGAAIRTQSYMTYPIFSIDGDVIACIQCLSKDKKGAKTKQKLYAGFSNFDELFFGMFVTFV